MIHEFHLSVTPVGANEFLVRTEKVAPGVPLAEEQFTWPVNQWLTQARELLDDPLPGITAPHQSAHSAQNFTLLGQQLCNALFQGTIRDSWVMAQAIAQHRQEMLRLRLGVKGSLLSKLPWECLHDGDRPLATGADVLFSRYQPTFSLTKSPTISQPWGYDQPLRILMVIAAPTDQDSLELKQEVHHLRKELYLSSQNGNQIQIPDIQLSILEQPGREQLTQALEQGNYQVLHYAGHSNLGASGGSLYLVSGRTGLTELLSGDDLAGLLANNGIRMAVFNSCWGVSAASQPTHQEVGQRNLAEALIRRGIPSVLAIAERIPDKVALTLSRLFYRNLKQGYSIDLSLSRARQGLLSSYGSNQLFWILPILYIHQEFDGFLLKTQSQTDEEGLASPSISVQARRQPVLQTMIHGGQGSNHEHPSVNSVQQSFDSTSTSTAGKGLSFPSPSVPVRNGDDISPLPAPTADLSPIPNHILGEPCLEQSGYRSDRVEPFDALPPPIFNSSIGSISEEPSCFFDDFNARPTALEQDAPIPGNEDLIATLSPTDSTFHFLNQSPVADPLPNESPDLSTNSPSQAATSFPPSPLHPIEDGQEPTSPILEPTIPSDRSSLQPTDKAPPPSVIVNPSPPDAKRFHELSVQVAIQQRAIATNPANAHAYFNLGSALAEQGNLSDAIVYYEKAIQLEPSSIPYHELLAISLDNQAQVMSANSAYESAIVHYNRAAVIFNEWGRLLCNHGDLTRAMEVYGYAISAYNQAATLHNTKAGAMHQPGGVSKTANRQSPPIVGDNQRNQTVHSVPSSQPLQVYQQPKKSRRSSLVYRALAITGITALFGLFGIGVALQRQWHIEWHFSPILTSVSSFLSSLRLPGIPSSNSTHHSTPAKTASLDHNPTLGASPIPSDPIPSTLGLDLRTPEAQEQVKRLLDENRLTEAATILTGGGLPEVPALSLLQARLMLQSIHSGQGNYTLNDVQAELEKATRGSADPVAHNALGFVYYAQGDLNAANRTWYKLTRFREETRQDKLPDMDLLTAMAGWALVFQKEASNQPIAQQEALFNQAVTLRDDILRVQPGQFQPDVLTEQWMWTDQALNDWRLLLERK